MDTPSEKPVTRQRKSRAKGARVDVPEPYVRDPLPDPHDVDDEMIAPDDVLLQDSLRQLDAELGANVGDAKVKIYRVDPRTRERVYLQTLTVPEYIDRGEDELRDQYGSGEYAVRVYAAGRLYTHRKLRVEAGRAQSLGGATRAAVNDPNAQIGTSVIQAIAALGEQMQNTLSKVIESNKPPALTDRLAELKLLRDVFAPDRERAPNVQGASLTDFMKMFEFAKSLIPRENGQSDLGALADIAKPLMQTLAAQAASGKVPTAASVAAPSLPDHIAGLANVLTYAMRSNLPCDSYIDPLIDAVGEDACAQLLSQPQWFESLCALVPEAATHRPWVEAFRSRILEALTDGGESATTGAIDPKPPTAA